MSLFEELKKKLEYAASPEGVEQTREFLGMPSGEEIVKRTQEGRYALNPLEALGIVGRPIESVTAAPARAAISSLQGNLDMGEAMSAFAKQFGRNPSLAPTGEQIAERAGLQGKAAAAAGLGLDIAVDPSSIMGGAALKALPLLGLAGTVAKMRKAEKAADLPMDLASRMRRAEEMGFTQKGFHGSFRDISKFEPSVADVEGRFGKSIYVTSSPEDASLNYASRSGPDPSGKFSRKLDELQAKRDSGEIPEEADLYELASKELFGTSAAKAADIGTVYPLRLKMKNPLRLGVKNETYLDFTPKFDKDGEFVSEAKLTNKLIKSLKSQAKDNGFDADQVLADLGEIFSEGEIRASQLDEALRRSESLMSAEDSSGKLSQSEVIRKVYEDLGFDGIVIDAKKTFPNMPNIAPGTEHFMVFKPSQLRSEFAKFDPAKAKSGVITAGAAGVVSLPMLIEKMRRDREAESAP